MKNTVLSIVGQRWRELVGFALLFRMLESLLFAPVAALAGKWLLGRAVLDSTALVSFLLSPRGFLALALAAVTALSIRLIEHAGLSAIFFGAFDDRRVSSRQALGLVWRHQLMLVRVSACFVGVGLLTVLPLLAVAGGFAVRLLGRHDVNYYLKLRPPEFIAAAVVIGVVALGSAAVMLSLLGAGCWVHVGCARPGGARRGVARSFFWSALAAAGDQHPCTSRRLDKGPGKYPRWRGANDEPTRSGL